SCQTKILKEQQQQEEEEEQQALSVLETPVSGPSRTGRAVNLARLLHHECTELLRLYKNRETFLLDHTPDGSRIVSPSPPEGEPRAARQVQLLHSALRQCLGLLHCVIQKEEEEWGKLEEDYESMKKNVRVRLEDLLYTTKNLVENEDGTLEVTPDHQCTEEVDGAGGVFGLKMWIYRVLVELAHWSHHAVQTLHVLHKQTQGVEKEV
uniref:Uncharacterized protein n=1 Tax=Oryzias latipes TaxID=8090 RepID=A0A3B3IID4_ORYLA